MKNFDFNGRLAIHPGEALYLVGYSRTLDSGKKTARNLIYLNTYPLPLTVIAGQKRVLVRDLLLAAGIDEQAFNTVAEPFASQKRGPGRPRKLPSKTGGNHHAK